MYWKAYDLGTAAKLQNICKIAINNLEDLYRTNKDSQMLAKCKEIEKKIFDHIFDLDEQTEYQSDSEFGDLFTEEKPKGAGARFRESIVEESQDDFIPSPKFDDSPM